MITWDHSSLDIRNGSAAVLLNGSSGEIFFPKEID